MKFHTDYDHPESPGMGDWGPSLTKQEFREESDVNNIVGQYETDGIAPASGTREPMFGDFSAPELNDYRAALELVDGANDVFNRVPARVRERFANDPALLIEFVQDPRNTAEAYELGLLREDYQSPSTPPLAPPTAPPATGTSGTTGNPPNANPVGTK